MDSVSFNTSTCCHENIYSPSPALWKILQVSRTKLYINDEKTLFCSRESLFEIMKVKMISEMNAEYRETPIMQYGMWNN